MVGIPNFSARFFQALADRNINVIIITQASSEHTICVGIQSFDQEKAVEELHKVFKSEINSGKIDPIEVEQHLSIVALVGSNMKSQVGISGQMFSVLGRNGINIKTIAQGSSERNITVVIEKKHLKKALNALHESFFIEVIVALIFEVTKENTALSTSEYSAKPNSFSHSSSAFLNWNNLPIAFFIL